jgi:hypothetical protein
VLIAGSERVGQPLALESQRAAQSLWIFPRHVRANELEQHLHGGGDVGFEKRSHARMVQDAA